ncbi:MAG TPA: response regulator [bacterium]|jgi:chemotaxis family two-component system response regulator Rcp1|nr:response regulator [bacterium]
MKTGAKEVKPFEILLVEDNPADASLMRRTLESSRWPIRLKVAPDGEEALAYLRRAETLSKTPYPDFILLDLGLPKKSGWEVLSSIKEDSGLRKIPVLILTGSRNGHDLLKARFSFADDYLLKPLDFSHLGALVNYLEETWLKKNRSDIPPAR